MTTPASLWHRTFRNMFESVHFLFTDVLVEEFGSSVDERSAKHLVLLGNNKKMKTEEASDSVISTSADSCDVQSPNSAASSGSSVGRFSSDKAKYNKFNYKLWNSPKSVKYRWSVVQALETSAPDTFWAFRRGDQQRRQTRGFAETKKDYE